MKRFILLVALFLLALGVLCGCGNSDLDVSKEAVNIELSALLNEMTDNTVRAEEIYNGKLVKIDNYEAEFIEIYNDYAVINMTYWGGKSHAVTIYANVSKDAVANIDKGDKISVVGVIDITSPYTVDLNGARILEG